MSLSAWFTNAASEIAARLPRASGLRAALQPAGLGAPAVHLAVFAEPFLGFVLEGSKTIESRFSSVKVAPYELVERGDLLLLKAVGGPIVAASVADRVCYYAGLTATVKDDLHLRFGAELRDDVPRFWEDRCGARFATLIRLGAITSLEFPMDCPKKDRRGWVVLRERHVQLRLFPS